MTVDKHHALVGLRKLAEAYGVQTSYTAMGGKICHATPEALQAALGALGAPLDRLGEADALLHERRAEAWRRRLEPVTVIWGKEEGTLAWHLGSGTPPPAVGIEITTAQGEVCRLCFRTGDLATLRKEADGGSADNLVKAIPLPRLPWGYHTLRLEAGGEAAETMIIAAPQRAFEPEGGNDLWGNFLPLYALQGEKSWGLGDLGDFGRLVEWTQSLGGAVVGTLPLLATFLDEPFEPSPYVPASRLFWNECYIEIGAIPELAHSPAARAIVESGETRHALQALRAAPLADYRGVMQLKERVLRELALEFFMHRERNTSRWQAFEQFVRDHPKVRDYAAFRAACRQQHGSWHAWPEPMKQGTLSPADYDEDTMRYYLYAQFIVQEQMDRLSELARRGGPGLYLDLPLGVHPDSYDVWRERGSFAWGVSGGAPPDLFFSKGQDWGFAPLHPLRMRERRYRYIIECVQRLMRQAGAVRIDHVMGLHRLFWVPSGMEATQGVYVSYPAEELHAILNVESHRWHSMIVGEDLGTVPESVTRAMHRHNVHGMSVLQFCIQPRTECLVSQVPPGVVASVNTHDMPTFAGFWQGRDIDNMLDLGLYKPTEEADRRAERAEALATLIRFLERESLLDPDPGAAAAELPRLGVIQAALEYLGKSDARIVLVNLEDLWQELRQQNVPGTSSERPNWRHKARYSLEEFTALPKVREVLVALDRARKVRSGS